jgi:glutamate-ammonia-ligase adenylyltransferase
VLDVKLLRGGLVDVEFLVHYLQLRHARELAGENLAMLDPDFAVSIPMLIELGLLNPRLWPAYDLMTDVLVAGRLLAPDGAEPPPAAAKALARACERASYETLLRNLEDARACTARQWRRIFDTELET